jgi:hypothetical protein
VEAPLFWKLVLKENLHFKFPSKRVSTKGLLPKVAKKTKDNFVSISLTSCNTCTMSFDLSMLKRIVHTFVLIVQFLDDKWELCHVTMGFLKIVETIKGVLALQMNDLL